MLGVGYLNVQPQARCRQGFVTTSNQFQHGRLGQVCEIDGYGTPFLSSGLSMSNTSTTVAQLQVAKVSVPPAPHIEEDNELSASHESKGPTNLITSRSVLCMSNGHGEDSIAASILRQLLALGKERGIDLQIEALPLVGEGHMYRRLGIPTVGPTKIMPSGGFIYMDILQLVRDMRAGLVSLTLDQWGAVAQWADKNPDGVLLAVGDVFPLAMAWLASKRMKKRISENENNSTNPRGFYAFVGTAKSEYYVRESDGSRLRLNWFHSLESVLFPGSVYYPWERALMSDSLCRLVVPRDGLTAQYLQKHLPQLAQAKVQDFGNPMMDDLQPTGGLGFLDNYKPARFIAVLPGSRAPEVYNNWKLLVTAMQEASLGFTAKKSIFLVPIVPSLEPGPFMQVLSEANWQPHTLTLDAYKSGEPVSAWAYDVRTLRGPNKEEPPSTWPANNGMGMLAFERQDAVTILIRGNFNDVAYWAEAGIAMAGTATEQLVGQGKPVFTIPGSGPQFTAAFAEAQSRLLGKSIIMCQDAKGLAGRMKVILSDTEQLVQIAANGHNRMGHPGAGRRISQQLLISILI